jgi:hypothetical protein
MSGRGSGGNPDRVLELLGRDPVLIRDGVEGLAGAEQREGIFESGSAASKNRLPKAACGIDNEFGDLVGREPDQSHVAVGVELEALQVSGHDLVEHTLAVAHDDKLAGSADQAGVVGRVGVVEQDLRPVRVEALARQGVGKPELRVELFKSKSDALAGAPAAAHRGQHNTFGKPDERDNRTRRGSGRSDAT